MDTEKQIEAFATMQSQITVLFCAIHALYGSVPPEMRERLRSNLRENLNKFLDAEDHVPEAAQNRDLSMQAANALLSLLTDPRPA